MPLSILHTPFRRGLSFQTHSRYACKRVRVVTPAVCTVDFKESSSRTFEFPRRELLFGAAAISLLPSGPVQAASEDDSIYSLSALQYGEEVTFEKYKGLRTLYEKYGDQGFNIIAFPCNQFGGQAPGTSEEERQWAFKKFGFEFPVMDKIEVNGPGAHPIYKVLKRQQPVSVPSSNPPPPGEPGRIEWNYTKFLVGRDGRAVRRYKPGFDPLEFEGDLRLALAEKDPLPTECFRHPGRKVCKVEQYL